MKICDIEAYFQTLYPNERSCSWDCESLQVCSDRHREVKRVITCLDVTFSVIEKAISAGCELIVSHHPLIFAPVSSVNEETLVGQKLLLLIQNGISLISLHTRFDGAVGGLNEKFGEKMGLAPVFHKPLLPEEPYIGAVGVLADKMSPELFARKVAASVKAPVKLYSAGLDLEKIGYCCGSGKDLVRPCLELGVDAFVGGDIPYHVAQEAVEKGMTVIDCGHHASEKEAANYFAEALCSLSLDLEVIPMIETQNGEIVDFS